MKHPIFIFTNIYVLLVFLAMYSFKVIGVELIKDYVVWIFSALYPLISKVSTNYSEISVKRIFFETFKLSVIPMFIISEYTLSLWAELFIVPLCVFIGGLLAVADTDAKYALVKKLFNYVLMIIGVIFIFVAFKGLINNISDVLKIDFYEKMFMDFVGIILHTPLLLMIQFLSFYEQIIIRTNLKTRFDKIRATLIIIRRCKLNKQQLIRNLRDYKLRQVNTIQDFKETLQA
ncbi:hypothetical protein LQV63_25750 [Paenibacillus profundus]|uniref:Uncharacterized protein n=2 Tax=Paenibacillus profundus TaxID=1173085 RepID=A0ABS8YN34_9BACL|nr:hypothetical protein [Paenibacillus profundus]